MKFKVFGIILISFIVVMVVNSAARVFGESLKDHAAKSMLNQVKSSQEISNMSRNDVYKFVTSPENTEMLITAHKKVKQKYYWYHIIKLVAQVLLLFVVAIVTSWLTINVVRKSIKL